MCSRKCGTGLKRIFVLLVLSALVVGQLAAVSWPWAWGNKDQSPQEAITVEAIVPDDMMLLPKASWNELKAQLTARETAFRDLKASYEAELKTLRGEIATLKALSPISTELHNALIADKEVIIADLQARTEEGQAYYQQLLVAQNKKIGGIIGGAATYDIGRARYGAELEMGIRFGDTFFTVGVGYAPDTWKVAVPDPRDLVIKAGVMRQF